MKTSAKNLHVSLAKWKDKEAASAGLHVAAKHELEDGEHTTSVSRVRQLVLDNNKSNISDEKKEVQQEGEEKEKQEEKKQEDTESKESANSTTFLRRKHFPMLPVADSELHEAHEKPEQSAKLLSQVERITILTGPSPSSLQRLKNKTKEKTREEQIAELGVAISRCEADLLRLETEFHEANDMNFLGKFQVEYDQMSTKLQDLIDERTRLEHACATSASAGFAQKVMIEPANTHVDDWFQPGGGDDDQFRKEQEWQKFLEDFMNDQTEAPSAKPATKSSKPAKKSKSSKKSTIIRDEDGVAFDCPDF